jgi:hypothetical protein
LAVWTLEQALQFLAESADGLEREAGFIQSLCAFLPQDPEQL